MSLRGLFVTGTDTGVGKTRIARGIVQALLADGRSVGAMKPIATSATLQPDGSWASPDALELRAAAGGNAEIRRINPFVYQGDLAPSVAMRKAGRPLDSGSLLAGVRDTIAWWSDRCEILIVEGVGGWLCPITDDATVADLAVSIDYPAIVVARIGLGTLNHTLMTIESIRRRGVRLAGVVLNRPEGGTASDAEETNPGELARWLGPVPILSVVAHSDEVETLSGAMHGVDWWGRAAGPRLLPPDES